MGFREAGVETEASSTDIHVWTMGCKNAERGLPACLEGGNTLELLACDSCLHSLNLSQATICALLCS